MEFFIAMRHLCLNSVLNGEEEEVPVADKTIFRDRLHARDGKSEVSKQFTVWNIILSSLKIDDD